MLNLTLVPDDDDGMEGTLSSIDEDNEDRDSSVGGTDEEVVQVRITENIPEQLP